MKKTGFEIILFLFLLIFSCTVERDIDIGHGYVLVRNAVNDTGIVNENDHYIIYGHVVSYHLIPEFLIVAERPRDSVPEAKGLPLKEKNRIFYSSDFIQYWIVENESKKKFGPYKLNRFKSVCDSLDISLDSFSPVYE